MLNSPSLPSPFRQPREFYEYCIMLAALTACLYDHALTFDSEVISDESHASRHP
ncbi:hypothetical protein M422DRAFT_273304 [Sphaerobolus stellatus SS14]|uniref:Uncharacterized protein n=1 Tax=Sphaerobolus stellatus (strain SS14) TaxID=990650 RepID=A0A0C9UJZ1_SPHS4|nr:hypothetical protein M422DRAFT_273304 [Sphaerobolus stellatus SS14]